MDFMETLQAIVNLKVVFVLLHVIGTALGVGGASVTDFLFMKAIRRNRLNASEFYFISSISYVLLAGLSVLFLSGIGFLWIHGNSDQSLLENPKLWAKVTIVLILAVNGWVMHKYLIKSLKGLVGKPLLSTPFLENLTLMFSCGTLSVVSWYTAVVLGVWKEANFRFGYWTFVAAYLAISVVAILTANLLGRLAIRHLRTARSVTERRFEDSVKCSLTGLYNRRMAYELVTKCVASRKRTSGKFSLILFDIDNFDRINSDFDDILADETLVQVGEFLNRELRDSDWLFRFGADEFLMLLPDCDAEGARMVAERTGKKINQIRFEVLNDANEQGSQSKSLQLSLSSAVMCVALEADVDRSIIEFRSQGRLRLVDASSSKPILNQEMDGIPLMS